MLKAEMASSGCRLLRPVLQTSRKGCDLSFGRAVTSPEILGIEDVMRVCIAIIFRRPTTTLQQVPSVHQPQTQYHAAAVPDNAYAHAQVASAAGLGFTFRSLRV